MGVYATSVNRGKMVRMGLHPSVKKIVAQLEAAELHAAHSGREVMRVLIESVNDSLTDDTQTLALEVETSISAILKVMPAYAPPLNVMHRFASCLDEGLKKKDTLPELKARLAYVVEEFQRWAQDAPDQISRYAVELIQPGMTVYTHTLSETVLRSLTEVNDAGIHFNVLVTESQPNCDGRVTAYQLGKMGIEVKIGIDAGIGEFLPQADLMLSGAEAIITPEFCCM